MRILALAVLATIIVVSGIWLARDRSQGEPASQPATPAAERSSAPPAGTAPAESAEDEAPAAAEDAAGQPADAAEDAAGQPADAADEAASEQAEGAAPDTADDSAPDTADDATPGAATDASDPDGEADPAAAAEAESESAEDLAAVLPAGYDLVEFLTDVPQQAFDAPEQVLDPDLDYVAVIRTSVGDIEVELYEDLTPVTVNNFVFLALHRYFEGVPFHRVLEEFMAQTGDPTGTGTGGPGYQFDDEIVEGLEFDSEGILAMANAGPGTNGSQFFITFSPTPWLTGAHTIFGHVTDGLAVLDEITRVDPTQPSAAVAYSGTVGDLAAQGVELPAHSDDNIAEAIEELLGALPSAGQSFSVAGYRGVAGQLGTEPAFGFFLNPDQIDEVIIAARPR